MTPSILFQDNHLLVVSKPAGMPAQPDESGDTDLLTWAKLWIKVRYGKPGNVYLGLVHRLDRPASGITVFARTSKAAARLAHQFRERTVDKRYLAIVEGVPAGSDTWVDHLVKEGRTPRVVPESAPGARRAELAFNTVETRGGLTVVEVLLKTGRAHQIRLQFASRGFPLLGDLRYGARSSLDGQNLALHGYRLGLQHPTGGGPMQWIVPPPATWPVQFADSIARLTG